MFAKWIRFSICAAVAVSLASAQNARQPGQTTAPYAPLSVEEKLKYRFSQIAGPRGLAFISIGAGFEQIEHSPREWGGGISGYAKRYGSTLGTAVVEESLSFALESALHEDPRYFPLDGPSKKARIWSALRQTFTTRNASGVTTFAYGRVASAFAAGQVTRVWTPASTNSAMNGLRTTSISFGVDAAINMLYEFAPSARPK